MSEGRVKRARLNLRFPQEMVDAFEDELVNTFRYIHPRAGIEVKDVLRAYLDEGRHAILSDAVERVINVVGQTNREKKSSWTGQTDSGTKQVQYRVAADVKEEFMKLATEDYRSAGTILGRILYRYVTEGSIVDREVAKLRRAEPTISNAVGSSSKQDKVTTLVDALDDGQPFTLKDFDEANENSIQQGKPHARETYLPRVLDELDYTWSPAKTGVFVSNNVPDSPENKRDPRTKPYLLMTDAGGW